MCVCVSILRVVSLFVWIIVNCTCLVAVAIFKDVILPLCVHVVTCLSLVRVTSGLVMWNWCVCITCAVGLVMSVDNEPMLTCVRMYLHSLQLLYTWMQYVLVSVCVRSMQRVELCIIIIILIKGYSHLTRTKPDQLHVIYMHLLIFVYVCPHFLMFLKVHVHIHILIMVTPRALLLYL